MPKISIIVPVYKVEDYISECLISIEQQTFTDWECLLIDDGSPDMSGLICDEYAQRDSRFKVFHMTNGGVSQARNIGIDNMSGEWTMFVDSDDELSKDALAVSISYAEHENLDLLQFSYVEEKQFLGKNDGKKTNSLESDEYIKKEKMLVSVWGGLFRSSIIRTNKLLFDTCLKQAEDQLFVFNFINKAKRCKKIDDCLYMYRVNLNGATHKQMSADMISSMNALINFKKKHPNWNAYVDRTNVNLLTNIILNGDVKFSLLKKLTRSSCLSDTHMVNLRLQSLFSLCCKYNYSLAILLVIFRRFLLKNVGC